MEKYKLNTGREIKGKGDVTIRADLDHGQSVEIVLHSQVLKIFIFPDYTADYNIYLDLKDVEEV